MRPRTPITLASPRKRRSRRSLLLGCLLVLLTSVAAEADPFPANLPHAYPRVANIYWQTSFDPVVTIPELARWPVVVLNPIWTPGQLAQLRALNPDIKIFFMVNLYSMPIPGTTPDPWRIANVEYAEHNDMWWYNTNGERGSDWPDTWMVNVTAFSATGSQGHWVDFFAGRVVELLAQQPDLDGIYFDNFWKQLSWQQGWQQLDSDCNPTHRPQGCDGVADTNEQLDAMWNSALRDFADDLRSRLDSLQTVQGRTLGILTNNSSDYFEYLNGTMHEYFPSRHSRIDYGNPYRYNWWEEMLQYPGGYLVSPFNPSPYTIKILNAEAQIVGNDLSEPIRSPWYERHKRFALASALLGDGYLSLDAGHPGHGSLWWEPEYDHAGRGPGYLGMPLGEAQRILQANGPQHLHDPGFDDPNSEWHFATFDASGSWTLDTTEFQSAPSAARIDVTATPGPNNIKIWQPGIPLEFRKTYTLRFRARSTAGQVLRLFLSSPDCPNPRCLSEHRYLLSDEWTLFETSFSSFVTTNASLDMFLDAPGTVWLDDFELVEGDTRLFRRDFEHGIVLLNMTEDTQSVSLESTYHRLDIPTSDVFDGQPLTSESLAPSDGRILLRQAPGPLPPPSGDPTDAFSGAHDGFLLHPGRPNPFQAGTRIRFAVPREGHASVTVHDVRGRLVRRLWQGPVVAGRAGEVWWNGRNDRGASVVPGTYFVRLQVDDVVRTRKILLAR